MMKGETTVPMPGSEGLSDAAATHAHDMIHHAEAEQHEHEADRKRGLPDSAVDAEREGLDQFEHPKLSRPLTRTPGCES